MKKHLKSNEKIREIIQNSRERDRLVWDYKMQADFKSKFSMQISVAAAFFVLSIANIAVRSYVMLALTALGFAVNAIFAILAKRLHNGRICSISAIATCACLFGFFVIYGGNDGFTCLWVILLPLLSMVVMDFAMGFCMSVFFQIFLIVVFWTPVREHLFYQYNDQFCLRFPLFFLVTFILDLVLTLSLRRSEYNECCHLRKLEEMNENARIMARTDSLTKLANRYSTYESFEAEYEGAGEPHCVVMGDIDNFKTINDTYGHEFGDEVLCTIADYIRTVLPQNYLKSRWGGEEFLFAANASVGEVCESVEKLRMAIAAHEFQCGEEKIQLTLTFGIASYTGREDITEAINTADSRLYAGKRKNKNCTMAE